MQKTFSGIQQIAGLQMLRAVAVILVIWFHLGQHLDAHHLSALPGFNVFGIDIFFVISGFILSLIVLRERRSPGRTVTWDFLKRRFIRIYPIYWVVALLVLARMAHAGVLMQGNYWSAFFLLPSFVSPVGDFIIGYSWTMMFELFFYALLSLILLRTVRWAIPALIGLLGGLVAIGLLCDIRHPVWIVASNPILLEFVFGAVLALLYARVGARRRIGMALTGLGVCASCWFALHNPSTAATGAQLILADEGVFLRVATWGVCALLLVAGIVFWSPPMHKPLARLWLQLGNASYSTYVLSALVMEFATRAYFHVRSVEASLLSRTTYEVSLTVLTLAAGYACYAVVEKPLLRMLHNRLLHEKKTPTPSPALGEVGATGS
jgi:exopolysaccharide production protein ExoZ